MTELLTAAQMRATEEAAIASGEVTGLELMERAGRGVVEAVFAEWPELGQGGHRAVVLCGPGNNGGDGFVVARLLKERGWEVEVFLYGDPEKLPPDARVNYDRVCGVMPISTRAIDPPPLGDETFRVSPRTKVIVDAVFGTGLSRPHRSLFSMLADPNNRKILRDAGCRFVAVDVPTGLCADSGRNLGIVLEADLTVTFHAAKLGHFTGSGPMKSGQLRVKGIGLPTRNRGASAPLRPRPAPQGGGEIAPAHGPAAKRSASGAAMDPAETVRFVTAVDDPGAGCLAKDASDHKYSHGHALILSGGVGRGGAARLAARGALRIGAGAVTLGCPPAALIENAAQLNAVMLTRLADAEALTAILEDDRINALCLGPGLGTGAREAALVAAVLTAKRPTVLDADALTLLSREADLFARLNATCVLTPHAGEFKRLFPDIAEKLAEPATRGPAYSKVDATREAARRAGCVMLYKGPDTVIADPTGRCSISSAAYDRAAPWLATAGAGDVLSGFITGLLARGFAPMQAAGTAAWLHVESARRFGPGLIAEDLPETLPQVLQAVLR